MPRPLQPRDIVLFLPQASSQMPWFEFPHPSRPTSGRGVNQLHSANRPQEAEDGEDCLVYRGGVTVSVSCQGPEGQEGTTPLISLLEL